MRLLNGVWLGQQPYEETYALQSELLELRKRDEIDDVVLLLEHSPTITLGKGAHGTNLLASPEALQNRGIHIQKTDRGGDITLHAPGQLVAYPIVNLAPSHKDVRKYVQNLTKTMQALVTPYRIACGNIDGLIGLWCNPQCLDQWHDGVIPAHPAKLGAVGVRISKWVTMHGFALNLTTDLSLFRMIVPCGISEYSVASVESVTGVRAVVREEARTAWQLLTSTLERRPGRYVEAPANANAALARKTALAAAQHSADAANQG